MIFWETLHLAFSSLVANKLRAILTMIGIAIGVCSIIGVMTVIDGVRKGIEENLNVLGANSFQISKFPAVNFSDPRTRFANRKDITYRQGVRFRELMADTAQCSIQIGRGGRRVFRGERSTNPSVGMFAGDELAVAARNREVAAGRDLTPEDVEYGRPVVLLGNDVVKRLFVNEDPLGQTVRIDGQNLTVIGLINIEGNKFGQSADNFVIVPVTQFLETYGRAGRSMTINVKAKSQTEFAATQDQAIGMMRLVRGLDPEDPNDFEMFSNDTLIESFNKIAGVIAIGAFVISAIALLAAGVGVMNIMLVSVTERTREIGIRKSIGARKMNILTQFLIEAVAISILGGLAGIILGVAFGNALFLFMGGSFSMPWMWTGLGVLVCGGIGVGFGLYPAWRAANLDPIEALRYE